MSMVTKSSVEAPTVQGPSGFIEIAGQMLVVDYGKVYHHDGSPIGFLYEDGFLKGTGGPLGNSDGFKTIEEVEGCVFRGIDATGLELVLPSGARGPTGSLTYNGILLQVNNGRVSTQDHQLVGELT